MLKRIGAILLTDRVLLKTESPTQTSEFNVGKILLYLPLFGRNFNVELHIWSPIELPHLGNLGRRTGWGKSGTNRNVDSTFVFY